MLTSAFKDSEVIISFISHIDNNLIYQIKWLKRVDPNADLMLSVCDVRCTLCTNQTARTTELRTYTHVQASACTKDYNFMHKRLSFHAIRKSDFQKVLHVSVTFAGLHLMVKLSLIMWPHFVKSCSKNFSMWDLIHNDFFRQGNLLTHWRQCDFAVICISHRPQPEYTQVLSSIG